MNFRLLLILISLIVFNCSAFRTVSHAPTNEDVSSAAENSQDESQNVKPEPIKLRSLEETELLDSLYQKALALQDEGEFIKMINLISSAHLPRARKARYYT